MDDVDEGGGGTASCLTSPRRIERLHVEDVDALHLAQDLEALEARGLLEVGWDGAGRRAGREEVCFRFDLCSWRRRTGVG